jgi:hypothetical protein
MTSRQSNQGAFCLLTKTIEVNNFMVNNEGNEKTMPILLKDFLEFAKEKILGGDVPIENTHVDSNTYHALSEAMGLLETACEKLDEVKGPTAFENELFYFKKKMGVPFSRGNLGESDSSDEEDLDESGPAKKEEDGTEWQKHQRHDQESLGRGASESGDSSEEDSDEDEPARKKSKLSSKSSKSSKSTKDNNEKAARTKGKKPSKKKGKK